jgi:hypothetical protein
MRVFRRYISLGLLALFSLCLPSIRAADAPKKAESGVQIVKYSQLGDLVKKNRGKVVVVDFWATW